MWTSALFRSPSIQAATALLMLGVAGCGEMPVAPTGGPGFAAAKAAAGPTVTSTDPPFGYRDSTLAVKITGSGFAAGAQASWERNGAPDPKIAVLSTTVLSSTQIEARISIAGDAALTLYDVAVKVGGKKGIGTERFEVTTAIPIDGAGLARAVNDNGEVTGAGPYFWSESTGLELLGTSGSGWDLSTDGLTVVGSLGGVSASTGTATVWTRNGAGWAQTTLPRLATASNARAVASDPGTGAAMVIGGVETVVLKGNKFRREPRLWLRNGAAWDRTVLPGFGSSTEGQVNDLNADTLVVGNTPGGATVWSHGPGGWTVVVIGPAGSDALAINSAGTLIVGQSGNLAVYWQGGGTVWTGPTTLPGSCQMATGVDDVGRITASHCPQGNRSTAVVVETPYSTSSVRYLPGLGDRTDGAQAEAISPSGSLVVGRALLGNGGTIVAAYWNHY